MRAFALAVSLTLMPAAALAATPQEIWKASLADDNKGWATAPHAVLKIQDAAYIGEGNAATLVGVKGKPQSYHWVAGRSAGVLTAHVQNGHPVVEKDGKTYDETALAKGIPVDTGVDVTGAQTQVQAGVIGARIFVFNQQNPVAKAFKGVDYYPYDPAYVVSARFVPDPKLAPHAFRTSRGTTKQFYHVGDATFALAGKTVTLPFYADANVPAKIKAISAFFMDGLTGTETYGSGRYVDVENFGAFPPKTIAIDFNYAYNPNCAHSHFFTCPIALDSIAADVRAGERHPPGPH